MKNDLTFSNLLNIYECEISKNVKNKKKLYNFEINKIQNLTNIMKMLKFGDIGHTNYNIFLIFEPKCRLVMSLGVEDKIINHFITRFILEKKLERYLDPRNVATRKGFGTDYGIGLAKKYVNILKRGNKSFYILKIDISKYFYSIDHEVLKNEIKGKLDSDEYSLIEKVINSTNESYINQKIEEIEKNKNVVLPRYNYNKGLPIGNMTSQFLSVFYLHRLDHFIVHDLHIKYYVRYMDDFLLMSEDKKILQDALVVIKSKLENEYNLKINMKKTMITNSKAGFSFLGYVFKVIDGKTIIKIKKSNLEKVKKRVKKVRYEFDRKYISHKKAFSTIMTYSNCYRFCNNQRVMNIIDRYWYHEK